jgi:thiamine kinase-like enzyme
LFATTLTQDEILTQKLKELTEKNIQIAQMLKKIKETTPKIMEMTENTFNTLKESKKAQEKYEKIVTSTVHQSKNDSSRNLETDRSESLSAVYPK